MKKLILTLVVVLVSVLSFGQEKSEYRYLIMDDRIDVIDIPQISNYRVVKSMQIPEKIMDGKHLRDRQGKRFALEQELYKEEDFSISVREPIWRSGFDVDIEVTQVNFNFENEIVEMIETSVTKSAKEADYLIYVMKIFALLAVLFLIFGAYVFEKVKYSNILIILSGISFASSTMIYIITHIGDGPCAIGLGFVASGILGTWVGAIFTLIFGGAYYEYLTVTNWLKDKREESKIVKPKKNK